MKRADVVLNEPENVIKTMYNSYATSNLTGSRRNAYLAEMMLIYFKSVVHFFLSKSNFYKTF